MERTALEVRRPSSCPRLCSWPNLSVAWCRSRDVRIDFDGLAVENRRLIAHCWTASTADRSKSGHRRQSPGPNRTIGPDDGAQFHAPFAMRLLCKRRIDRLNRWISIADPDASFARLRPWRLAFRIGRRPDSLSRVRQRDDSVDAAGMHLQSLRVVQPQSDLRVMTSPA